MKYLILFLAFLFMGCGEIKKDEEEAIVYASGLARYENPTDPHESEAYNLSVGHWETDTIRYLIKNYPDRLIKNWPEQFSKNGFQDTIHIALSLWTEHTGKIFKRVESGDHEIFITIEKGDGFGGELARAWFPPLPGSVIKSVELKFDYWDIATLEGRAAFDFFQLRLTREAITSESGIQINQVRFYSGNTKNKDNSI